MPVSSRWSAGAETSRRGVGREALPTARLRPPAAGVAKIRELLSEHRIRPYDLGGVVAALGASRCDEAVDLLLEFAGADGKGVEVLGEPWIEAIGMLEGARSTEILLSFVDPGSKLFNREFSPDHRHGDLLARLLAERAVKDKALKNRLFELANADLTKTKRMILAKVFGQFPDEDDRVQGLSILRDDGFDALDCSGMTLGGKPRAFLSVQAFELKVAIIERVNEIGGNSCC